jgi:hypothetical protein
VGILGITENNCQVTFLLFAFVERAHQAIRIPARCPGYAIEPE